MSMIYAGRVVSFRKRPRRPGKPKIVMKTLHALILGLTLAGTAFAGTSLDAADQKWSAVVEKMIAAGNTTISTPLEKRVEIAKQLAEKAGRKAEVAKVDGAFRITFQ